MKYEIDIHPTSPLTELPDHDGYYLAVNFYNEWDIVYYEEGDYKQLSEDYIYWVELPTKEEIGFMFGD